MMNSPRNKIRILLGALCLALLIHTGGLLWMHDSKMGYYSPGKALWENSRGPEADASSRQDVSEETRKKNEILSTLFQEIALLHTDEKVMVEKVVADAWKEIDEPQDAMEDEYYHGEPVDHSLDIDMDEETPNAEARPAATMSFGHESDLFTSFRQQTTVEVVYPHDEALPEELIQAVETSRGVTDIPPADFVDAENAIKAGADDQGSQGGNALMSRSGLYDTGRVDTLLGGSELLLAADDVGTLKYTGLHHLPGTGAKEAVLPAGSRDKLRGFDRTTVGNIASSDDFDLKVEYAPRNGGGYFFKAELMPKEGVRFRKIAQNFFFLIDRSHSIRFLRYEHTKRAIAKLLPRLQEEDSFNILVFDGKVARFSEGNVAFSLENAAKGSKWIMQQPYGGLYGSTDLYASLGDIVPEAVEENEVNTAILLSDGDTYLSQDKQRNFIARWTWHNSGKVSLYTIASGKGNNLALLDLLSALNRGSLLYSATDKSLEATLDTLFEGIRNPIGKDISVTTVREGSDVNVTLYPVKGQLPNLYENTPYVVYGVVDKLEDFYLFYQGKYYDKSLDIKQKVSFAKAAQGNLNDLEKQIALKQAYSLYDLYLQEGRNDSLAQIKMLLNPFRIPAAFQ